MLIEMDSMLADGYPNCIHDPNTLTLNHTNPNVRVAVDKQLESQPKIQNQSLSSLELFSLHFSPSEYKWVSEE